MQRRTWTPLHKRALQNRLRGIHSRQRRSSRKPRLSFISAVAVSVKAVLARLSTFGRGFHTICTYPRPSADTGIFPHCRLCLRRSPAPSGRGAPWECHLAAAGRELSSGRAETETEMGLCAQRFHGRHHLHASRALGSGAPDVFGGRQKPSTSALA
ncbi:uncharacterized protein ACBT57_002358 isoform 1-T2 [Dama dama]